MNNDARQREFVAQYVSAERSVRQLLRLLVQDHRIFDDVCQAVALRLWELFDTYDPSRPFDAWARGVAANVVHELRRTERRAGPVLDPDAVAALVDGFERSALTSSSASVQLDALENCLGTLAQKARELIAKRYHQALPVEEVARQTNRSVEATYKALQRTLRQLSECVRQRVATNVSAS